MKKTLFLLPLILFVFLYVFYFKNLHSSTPSYTNITTSDVNLVTSSSHSLKPIPSNQWYSSLYKFPLESQPLFAFPLAYKITSNGLGFSYPEMNVTAKTIFAPYVEDFSIGLPSAIKKRVVTSIGDWNIYLKLMDDSFNMAFSIAQGLPYTTIHTNASQLVVKFTDVVRMYDKNKTDDSKLFSTNSFVATVRNHNYIFTSQKTMKVDLHNKTITIEGTDKVFVGLLDSRSHFELFKKMSATDVNGTLATPHLTADKVITEYSFMSTGGTPLVALLPHQYTFVTHAVNQVGTYHSLRGDMKLIQAKSFTTEIPRMILNKTFPVLKEVPSELTEQIQQDIKTTIDAKAPGSKDYFFGVWVGRVSNLLQLADTFGLEAEKKQLLDFSEPIFLDTLTTLQYDKGKTSLISLKPEFGNEVLNDHHFHYGYFVRGAAVISHLDPSFRDKISVKIDSMVKDIANTDRKSAEFPYLRNFAVYEGHSWADGFANFGDGNDQESTSEAINAWYGVYLWSIETKNEQLHTYAEYLLNTEIQSTYEYWFNRNNIYKSPYEHAIASIVWGGKADFATWFSGETNMIYGIQLLPFSPVSTYLSKMRNFSLYEKDITANGGGADKPWGDLYLMFKSFYQPQIAFDARNSVQKKEDANSRALMLYYLYSNKEKK